MNPILLLVLLMITGQSLLAQREPLAAEERLSQWYEEARQNPIAREGWPSIEPLQMEHQVNYLPLQEINHLHVRNFSSHRRQVVSEYQLLDLFVRRTAKFPMYLQFRIENPQERGDMLSVVKFNDQNAILRSFEKEGETIFLLTGNSERLFFEMAFRIDKNMIVSIEYSLLIPKGGWNYLPARFDATENFRILTFQKKVGQEHLVYENGQWFTSRMRTSLLPLASLKRILSEAFGSIRANGYPAIPCVRSVARGPIDYFNRKWRDKN